jgi:hypothetical protein
MENSLSGWQIVFGLGALAVAVDLAIRVAALVIIPRNPEARSDHAGLAALVRWRGPREPLRLSAASRVIRSPYCRCPRAGQRLQAA